MANTGNILMKKAVKSIKIKISLDFLLHLCCSVSLRRLKTTILVITGHLSEN